MMWNASVNAICDRAHGTGSTASSTDMAALSPSAGAGWSPTRSALAIAVRAGFTAPMLGKMLVSTT